MLARVLTFADVGLYSSGLSAAELELARLRPVGDLEHELGRLLDETPGARVCVLPRGPLTVASPGA